MFAAAQFSSQLARRARRNGHVAPFPPDSTQLGRRICSEVLGLLCPGNEFVGQESGCHVCPPASKTAGAEPTAASRSFIRGHFLKPDSDDLLVTLYGCGGNLLTHSASGWFVNRVDNLPEGICQQARRPRRATMRFSVSRPPQRLTRQSGSLTFGFIPDKPTDLAKAFDNTGGRLRCARRVVVQSAIREVRVHQDPERVVGPSGFWRTAAAGP